MNIFDFQTKKMRQEKISMMTCYDYSFAKILNESKIDCILVGDSAAMVMHGFSTTINANIEMMCLHTAAVVRGAPNKFIIGDMPFLSYRKELTENMNAIESMMKTGCHSLKLEGAEGNLDLIKHAVKSGVPIMGHLGLTPQSVHQLGGFKVQGRDTRAQVEIKKQALALQDAGCFAIVIECVPSVLAQEISNALTIPVIGIGAGVDVDGQVLVLQDMLGMNKEFTPKFMRKYFNGAGIFLEAFNKYHNDVVECKFPNEEESYS